MDWQDPRCVQALDNFKFSPQEDEGGGGWCLVSDGELEDIFAPGEATYPDKEVYPNSIQAATPERIAKILKEYSLRTEPPSDNKGLDEDWYERLPESITTNANLSQQQMKELFKAAKRFGFYETEGRFYPAKYSLAK